jgi:hypothetical protein
MVRRSVIILAAVCLLALASAWPTFAQTSSLSGTITAGTPLTGGRPSNNGPGCSSPSGGTFYSDLQTFVAPASGTWWYLDASYAGGGLDLEVNFYTGTFDPANPLGNGCFASFDDYGQVSLTAGVAYTIMVTTHNDGLTGSYEFYLSNGPLSSGSLGSGPTLTPGRPNEGNCTTTTAGKHYYALSQFTPAVSGTYVYLDAGYEFSTGLDVVLALYTGGLATFDPTNPTGNGCFWADDDEGAVSLTAGVTYTLMVTNYKSGEAGTYQYLLVGPGGAGGVANACVNFLPDGSVVKSIPAGAPTFYQPDLATQLSFNLPAGTWWTTGTSGDFTQVWIGCEANPVWVPTNAVAP